ncbi:MAG: small GTP-binding protein [Candidatus Parvarchaeum acidiphilum ARMAN-4]|jgi:translation initiation factor 5B|uniref:Small GTP-binding protein n=1 Tax=Candidatus Parvarchaeum acidiphilum ARMAN-4 TaxID=662760 RepID=D2EEI4_PARA4|nr:MAG: small GTP-binding protein [Candidatus Parvarchaeum acidiphilum ARMAN-4]
MRSPICAFLGHVDAGKTSIMDAIRDTMNAYKESGGLTQNIGSTEVPTDRIKEIASDLLSKFNINIKVPSILFIDSPGHEAFVTLRKRGASIADIVILTVDITEGIQNQTIESIEILKSYKTPFLIALTKIDTIRGFYKQENKSFLEFISKQNQDYIQKLDEKIYNLIADFSIYGFQAERYDRVKEFTKEISIIPLSSINSIGIKDLIVMIIGLSQRYLELDKQTSNSAAILEEKNVKGLGKVYDAIVYSGKISVGDKVIVQTQNGTIENKIKGIMRLIPMEESRENFGKYDSLSSIEATAPIRLILREPNAMIGTSITAFVSDEEKNKIIEEINAENVGYNNDESKGLVVCADSIGSIDAIRNIAKSFGIEIGKTKIGEPSKMDITTASINGGALICFNVPISRQTESMAEEYSVKIISANSIYTLFDSYNEFEKELKNMNLEKKLERLKLPSKFVFIKGNIFRRSSPCVFGVEVLGGEIRQNYPIINVKGERVGRILDIESDKTKLNRAIIGDKVAISIDDAVYGRNIIDGDILYTDISMPDVMKFDDVAEELTSDYREVLSEIRKIKGI